ncbi:uncharacterized protein LOC128285376 [Gossypium arboreum]|uniref:uncharacterized protein LOC128285376 n=1 Tax=Gossypium arboreum TaxID=29729 RepID=UPI0022F14644|nr:uncharacterized protein LOC128285376 [Gossypium arboreum]
MEKKSNESFRQYAQRWREVAIQVQPPLLEKETTILFINTLKAPFITYMLGSATKSFSDIVMTREMTENAVRSGKIESGESARKLAPRKRDNEVNNTSTFNKGQSKSITVNQPKTVTTNQQSSYPLSTWSHCSPRIPNGMTQMPNVNTIGITGHSIENCTAFKKVVERLIKVGIVRFDDPATPNVVGNLLPNHTDQGVNGISEGLNKKTKYEVAEVKTPLRRVWKEMTKRGLIALDPREESEEERNYCEFHDEVGHEIQECVEFRALVQNMIDNKETEFYEEAKSPIEGNVCASEGESKAQNQKPNYPVVIISRPKNNEAGIPGKESLVGASRGDQDRGSYTCSGRHYDTVNEEEQPTKGKAQVVEKMKGKATKLVNEPINEEEAKEFLKFLKHSEYSVVEQLRKQPARISVLALLLSWEVHRSTLMKVLNETYVANDISVSKLDRLVSNINADNYIFFNGDEIPPGA